MPQIISAEPLAQMIRSITLQKRTGVLRVEQLGERSAERGEIYFENGTLMRARVGRETGKIAFQRIGEWKQITCFFQGMSRPYPALSAGTASTGGEPVTRNIREHPANQTDRLARTSEPAEKVTEPRRPSLEAGERMTHPLNPRRAEIALYANARSSHLPVPFKAPDQPLVLHGTRLETYTPPQSASPSRSVQRWTTHLVSELETLPAPRKLPPEARLEATESANALPGRLAIFRARAAISAAQVIGRMERHARVVFILLDGRRTIQHIALLTHQTEAEVEQILVDLTQRGYTQYVSG